MSFSSRLRERREFMKMSRNDLAEQIGVTPSSIGNYENGISFPKEEILYKLFQALKIEPNYLWQDEIQQGNINFLVSYPERDHIKKYRALDSHGKKVVDFILFEEYTRSQQQAQNAPSHSIIYLPYPLQATSAGTGDFADDESAEQIPVVRNAWTSKADYIIRVHGNSMEPEIRDGDRLLVRSQPAVDPGEIGIFIHRGERFVKVYRETFLESYNPNYEDIPVEEDTRCIGKVICVLDPEWIESKQ